MAPVVTAWLHSPEQDAEHDDLGRLHDEPLTCSHGRRPLEDGCSWCGPTELCPAHGPYRPTSLLDADCPTCRSDADERRSWSSRGAEYRL